MSRLRLILKQLRSPALTLTWWLALATGILVLAVRLGTEWSGMNDQSATLLLGAAMLMQFTAWGVLLTVLGSRLWRNRGDVAAILYG